MRALRADPPMPRINADRLLEDLHRLRRFGATGTGVVRTSLSPVDLEARRWLAGRMEEAGLEPITDGVGNVFGCSRRPGRALLVGSHSDTQPTGGWLDGALGVVYGLEVARACADDPATRELPVDAVAWVDEEGTYLGCLGTRAFCGVLGEADVAAARHPDGTPLPEALSAAGLDGLAGARRLDPDRYLGYLEAHIEQGPYLEEAGNRIGVVTSIVGIRGGRVVFEGEQNHAGTTPMDRRRDAGVALFEFAHELRRAFSALAGPSTVWTIGRVELQPGAPSIIPGRAEMLLQFRDPETERLDALERGVEELAERASRVGPVAVRFERTRAPVAPTQMDARLQAHLAAAAQGRAGGRWVHMPSAAGHDPMVLAHHLPCAMLFIPSIGGISHDFAEDSREDDIVLGCQVLADATEAILREDRA